jgi:hypothetical protein
MIGRRLQLENRTNVSKLGNTGHSIESTPQAAMADSGELNTGSSTEAVVEDGLIVRLVSG